MHDIVYHKIPTVYERNPKTKFRTLIEGQFATPELEYLADNSWVWTEKIDGTNVRVVWDGETVTFGGKTMKTQHPPFLLNTLEQMFSRQLFQKLYPDTPMVIFGEGFGKGIQKAGANYNPDGTSFIGFDVWVNGLWLERHNVEDILNHLGVQIAPIVGVGTLHMAIEMCANGFDSLIAPGTPAEGLVMRPLIELQTRRGERIITKIKHKDFPK